MRHPVAKAFAAAFRDDGQPAFGIFLEHRALERIELVANENGDGHESLRGVGWRRPVIASEAKQSTAPKEAGLLRRFAPRNDAAKSQVISDNTRLTALMLRLSSNYESRTRYRHCRLIG